MLERQKILLKLAELAPGGRISRLRLVKYCFLMSEAWPTPMPSHVYSFLPYKYGPFSFTLYHELDLLIRDGELTACGDDIIRASGAQSTPLTPLSRHMIAGTMKQYSGETTSRLLDMVYARHPWFTLNSESVKRRSAFRPEVPCKVYTAGYEGAQVDAFLNRLLRTGIRQIIDVRSNPISRKYGYHKSTLSRLAGYLDMEYRHFPELGIPSAWRVNLECENDYSALFLRYVREILPKQESLTESVGKLMRATPSVLICQEADPKCCHRSHLAILLAKATSMPVCDIGRGEDE